MNATHPRTVDAGSPAPLSPLTVAAAPTRPDSTRLYRFATLSLPCSDLALDADSVRHVRRWTTNKADAWDVEEDGRSNLELIVSELVTNAILHTRADERSVRVALLHQFPADTGTRGLVWLEVRSSAGSGGTVPVVVRTAPEALVGGADLPESGRGMQLVDALATTWGVEPLGGLPDNGHLVWVHPEGGWAQVPAAVT